MIYILKRHGKQEKEFIKKITIKLLTVNFNNDKIKENGDKNMKDVERVLEEEYCIFCLNHKCKKDWECLKFKISEKDNMVTYKCLNFVKGPKKEIEFKEYLKYAFYDEVGNYVAIIKRRTPKNIIEQMKNKFDEVKFME